MAEQYQPINVNTGSAQQAIQATPNVTPALDGLMSSIKEGFISADDIRKRVASGPLEAATRQQDLADVQEVRPLQREAATAQLENVVAKEKFEANSLPILNDTKRAVLEQAHNNALQFGVPEEILKVFYATVPNFIPFDPEKLHDKKTGQVNIPYANEMILKARQAAAKMAVSKQFTGPVEKTVTGPTGETTKTSTVMDQLTGTALGPPIVTSTVVPNAAETEAKAKAASAALSNDVLAERQRSDIIQRFVPQLGAFDAIDKIRGSETPPTNSDDLAILYEFIKILDPTSVVREGEKKFAESTAPGAQAVWNKVQGLWSDSNKTMDLDTRNNLYATINKLREGAESSVIPELKRLSNLAIDRGMPLTQALTEPELKLLLNGPSAAATPVATTTPGVSPAATGGTPAAKPPMIDTTDRAAAAAALRALPPNVQFARFSDEPGVLVRNPNYRP